MNKDCELIKDCLEFESGTSAGTQLGPLLFIMHLHDVPSCTKPKFADDLVAVSVRKNLQEIQSDLQRAMNQLVQWAEKEAMVIDVATTKDMLFGEAEKKNQHQH